MLNIQNKIEFEGNCWIGEVDASLFNSSGENRIKAVTDLASITTGRLGFNDDCTYCDNGNTCELDGRFIKCKYCGRSNSKSISNRRKSLYNKLLTESAGKPSTPFEFVPIMDDFRTCGKERHLNYIKYGIMENDFLYTNLRNFKSKKVKVELFNSDIAGFKIIVGQVPWKVISHLRTHRAFGWLVESSRNKRYLKDVEFWYPSWWSERFISQVKETDEGTYIYLTQDVANKMLKPEEATMELSDRRLVKFAMCAWIQDKNAWDNLFAVRGKGTGTQSITGITVDNIKKIING
jgi:hypothetical protein